jgi:hypothetical protein
MAAPTVRAADVDEAAAVGQRAAAADGGALHPGAPARCQLLASPGRVTGVLQARPVVLVRRPHLMGANAMRQRQRSGNGPVYSWTASGVVEL